MNKNSPFQHLLFIPIFRRSLLGLALMILTPLVAKAQTNYFDNFPGAATDSLNGTAPSIRPGTNQVWTAATAIRADGSFTPVSGTASSTQAGYLPFNLKDAAPNIYLLSVSANGLSGVNVGLGFTKTNSTSVSSANTFSAGLFLIGSGSDSNNVRAIATNSFTSTNIQTFGFGQALTLNLQVDTREPTWTASFWVNDGNKFTANLNDAVKNEILGVGIHVNKAASANFSPGDQVLFDNFTLQVVPEPSSLMLLAFGGVAVLLLRRKLQAGPRR